MSRIKFLKGQFIELLEHRGGGLIQFFQLRGCLPQSQPLSDNLLGDAAGELNAFLYNPLLDLEMSGAVVFLRSFLLKVRAAEFIRLAFAAGTSLQENESETRENHSSANHY